MRILIKLSAGALFLASPSVANATTVIGFEDLQNRASFGTQDWNNWNTYQGFVWGYGLAGGTGSRTFDGNRTGWASATSSSPANSPPPGGITGTAYAWTWNGPQSLWIDFGAPTTVSSVDLATLSSGIGSFNSSTVQLFAYGNADNLVGSTGPVSLTHAFQTVNANLSGARYLELRSDRNRSWFSVDQLTLNASVGAVPEPDTWAMMLLGFGALGVALRRRKQRTTVSYA